MSAISDRIAAEMTEDQLRAEYEEACDTVYAGRTFPEYPCREHGHGDCAFIEDGPCTGELIDREIGRMRSEPNHYAVQVDGVTMASGPGDKAHAETMRAAYQTINPEAVVTVTRSRCDGNPHGPCAAHAEEVRA